jgi:hypothetical protein
VQSGYDQDEQAQKLLAALAIDPNVIPLFTFDQGILSHKGHIWLCNNATKQLKIFKAFHSSSLSKQITLKVKSYQVCQQAKPERIKYPGLLQPLPIPQRPWRQISMDFVEGMTQSGPYNFLMVVVEIFSKYAHFISLVHPYATAKLATLFVNQI